jgi:hypothetical protein
VQLAGTLLGQVGLTPGAIYYLATTNGLITTTAPSSPNITQQVGVAQDATTLILKVSSPSTSGGLSNVALLTASNVFTGTTQTVNGRLVVGGTYSSPVTAAQALSSSGTITLPTAGKNQLVSNTGAVTGMILTVGRIDGDEVTIINISANTVTFAVSGTSHVADGTSAIILANGKLSFVWSATQSLWYH